MSRYLATAAEYAYDPVNGTRLSSLRLPLTRNLVACFIACLLLVTVMLQLRSRGCSCQPLPSCNTWSCDSPLAYNLDDEWPSWPPAAGPSEQLPRDNLPSATAESRWLALHREHTSLVARSIRATKVVFLGDSITEGWLRSGFSGNRLSVAQPQCELLWHQHFGEWAPLNLAIGGDRVQDVGWRLQHGLLGAARAADAHADARGDVRGDARGDARGEGRRRVEARQLAPLVYVLMIGTNDLGAGEQPRVVAEELQLLLEQLHASQPASIILVHAILPRGGDDGKPPASASSTSSTSSSGPPRAKARTPYWDESNNHYQAITHVNAKLVQLAARHKAWLRYADCGEHFLARAYSPTDQLSGGEAPRSGGGGSASQAGAGPLPPAQYIPPHLLYDLLHLTPEGYALFGRCLRSHIAQAIAAQSPHANIEKAAAAAAAGASSPACVGRTCRGREIDLA